MQFNIGLNRQKFTSLVDISLRKNNLSYRAAAKLLGVSPSAFTRIKQEKAINVDSFLIISEWITDSNNIDYGQYFDIITR